MQTGSFRGNWHEVSNHVFWRVKVTVVQNYAKDMILIKSAQIKGQNHNAYPIIKERPLANFCESDISHIMKTCLYNFDPLEPHFYIEKLGFTGVYIIFLIFAQNTDCGYSLELPH